MTQSYTGNYRTAQTIRRNKGMAGKSAVPTGGWFFMLRRHCRHLRCIKLWEKIPNVIEWSHEKDVSVHVQQGVQMTQYILRNNQKENNIHLVNIFRAFYLYIESLLKSIWEITSAVNDSQIRQKFITSVNMQQLKKMYLIINKFNCQLTGRNRRCEAQGLNNCLHSWLLSPPGYCIG